MSDELQGRGRVRQKCSVGSTAIVAGICLLIGVISGIAWERASRSRQDAAWVAALKDARAFVRETPGYEAASTVLDPLVDRVLDTFRHGTLKAPKSQREKDALAATTALFLLPEAEETGDQQAIEVANRLLARVHLNSYWKDPVGASSQPVGSPSR